MKKYFAPIIIVGFILSWLIYQALTMISLFKIYGEQIPFGHKLVILTGIFVFSIALIYVLFQRIDELRKENKDDLKKY